MPVTSAEIDAVSSLVFDLCGIVLDQSKGYLIEGRLTSCSTGQEPYSMAMVLSELIPDIHTWDVSILATDISDSVIKQASAGRYSDFEIDRGMTPERREKYFVREAAGWRIRDEIRGLVTFRKLNLLEPFGELGPFDVVFCRNVAIYFSPADRARLFRRIVDKLDDGGYLFAGSSESLIDLGPEFVPQHHCRSVFYQPRRTGSTPLAK